YQVPSLIFTCLPFKAFGNLGKFYRGQGQYFAATSSQSRGRCGPIFSSAVDDGGADSGDAEDGNGQKESSQSENQGNVSTAGVCEQAKPCDAKELAHTLWSMY
ncbi:hypothetical protein Gorai_023081, partial [Gossypium raimondii]|nr:hypothetical protein [Gossypium raimondii]